MAKQRLYSRSVVGRLEQEVNPADLLCHFLEAGMAALEGLGKPIDWDTFEVTIARDDEKLWPGMHSLTITADSKED